MDNVLSTLLGSQLRAKLLRLFLLNPEKEYSLSEVVKLSRSKKESVNKELKVLLKIELIKQNKCQKEEKVKSKTKIIKTNCYKLNDAFPYLRSFKNLVADLTPAEEKEIKEKLSKAANIKLLLISGVFLQEDDARVDLFLVGNKIKEKQLEKAILELESVVGKELRFVAFTPEDFKYRISMYDKLIRDVLDKPYKEVVNKLGDFWKEISMV